MAPDPGNWVRLQVVRAVENHCIHDAARTAIVDDPGVGQRCESCLEIADEVVGRLGLEQVGWREVRHAPGYSDDGTAYLIKSSDVYEGRRPLGGFGAWTECEPLFRATPIGSSGAASESPEDVAGSRDA